jgi:hypothetical protein
MSRPVFPGTSLPQDLPVPPPARPAGHPTHTEAGAFARRALRFVVVGLLLYGILYFASERLVLEHGERNRFYMVRTTTPSDYDFVILGASRAAVFDYRDMNARLEQITGAKIMNLSTPGGGILVNRLLLEYFLTAHRTRAVVYVLDSFVFYSRAWNEERLRDHELFLRAPWDPTLAGLLLRERAARPAALAYISGFSKINNRDRFAPDRHAAEGAAFDRVYRAVPQIDRQRMAFLYPEDVFDATLLESPYLSRFEELIRWVQAHGIRFIIVRPPLPETIHRMLPGEERFEDVIGRVARVHGIEFHDLSRVGNDPEFFHDSDHLNQAGVLNLFENHLSEILTPRAPGGEASRATSVLRP